MAIMDEKKKRNLAGRLSAIPGADAAMEFGSNVKNAYKEKGIEGAIGTAVTQAPKVVSGAVMDFAVPKPVRQAAPAISKGVRNQLAAIPNPQNRSGRNAAANPQEMTASNPLASPAAASQTQPMEKENPAASTQPPPLGQQPGDNGEQYTPERIKSLTQAQGIVPGREAEAFTNGNYVGRKVTDPSTGSSIEVTGPAYTGDIGRDKVSISDDSYRSDGKYTFNGGQNDGLEVAFDPSASQDERKAFMRTPTRTGTRMRSGMGTQTYFGPEKLPGAGQTGTPVTPQLTQAPGKIGWHERMANNRMATDLAQTQMREEGATARAGIAKPVDAQGNAIEQMNAESLASFREAQAAGINAETAQKGQIQQLRNQYLAEGDPKKRAELENQLYTLQGKKQGNTGLDQKQWIEADNKLRGEYSKYYNSGEFFSEDPSDYLDAEMTQPIPYDQWARKHRGDSAGILYGEQAAEAAGGEQDEAGAAAMETIQGNPDYAEKYENASPEQKKIYLEKVKRLMAQKKAA